MPEKRSSPTPEKRRRFGRATGYTAATAEAARRQAAYDRFAAAVDGPLMVLALLLIPLVVVPLLVDLDETAQRIVTVLDWVIWAVFALEYAVKLYLAPDRWRFVRTHVPDLLLIVLPLLRPLRVLGSARVLAALRLLRAVTAALKALREVRQVLGRHGLGYALLLLLVVVAGGAALVLLFETGQPEPNIVDFVDALWWAFTTVTTVGYGDRYPTSDPGRVVAVLLMLSGIAVFGVMTATIAATFVEERDDADADRLAERLDEISRRLEAIERALGEDRERGGPAP
jgi:voltage-gated potassium channel